MVWLVSLFWLAIFIGILRYYIQPKPFVTGVGLLLLVEMYAFGSGFIGPWYFVIMKREPTWPCPQDKVGGILGITLGGVSVVALVIGLIFTVGYTIRLAAGA